MQVLLENGWDDLGRADWEGPAEPARLIVPAGPEQLADHYDLTLSHPAVDMAPFAAFERWLARAAARRGLSCALIHGGVVHEAVRRLGQGRLRIGFHLDYFSLWHVPDDPYARLAQAVQDAGGKTINPPARSRLFTDKSAAHTELFRHGLGVPETVLVRPWCSDRPLSGAEHRRLGLDQPDTRLYLKPANGFGQRGVVRLDPPALSAALANARQADGRDTFLLQREVRCPRLRCDDGVDRPAYWRILYCLGVFLPFWWDRSGPEQGRPSYRRVTAHEKRRHGLGPVLAYAEVLARLCGLNWFSTELCLSEGSEASEFSVRGPVGRRLVKWPVVAIDYVNDQCDVDVVSRWPGAPPDAVVRFCADRFAAAAARHAVPAEQAYRVRPAA